MLSGTAHADLAQWLQSEVPIATQRMLKNISRPGTAPGSVLAAPSDRPNYYFNWVRDSAIAMDEVVSLYQKASLPQDQSRYFQTLEDYVGFSRQLQRTPNRSGGADDLGLGEPKFNLDGSPFQGDWGRPQNDGPALRAIALIRLAETLLSRGNAGYVKEYLYDGKLPSNSVIKNDLEYIAHHWRDSSFDLWEENRGTHFFTRVVQRRALYDGARLADQQGDHSAADYYRGQLSSIEQEIERHWDPNRGIFVETIDLVSGFEKSSGMDSAVVLGILRGATDDGYMGVTQDRVIQTVERIRERFSSLYGVNRRTVDAENQTLGTAIGRYPEDLYDGGDDLRGNPWFLLTLAYAEFYYRSAQAWQSSGKIKVTAANAPLFRTKLKAGHVLRASDPRFSVLIQQLRDLGDQQLRRVHFHAGADGSLWEQFDRDSGFMLSAPDLTWSYTALLSATSARP